jgi:hypothetical protein
MMSEKKSLEEQIVRLEQNRNSWFEPLINWIQDAQTLNAIAVGTSLL